MDRLSRRAERRRGVQGWSGRDIVGSTVEGISTITDEARLREIIGGGPTEQVAAKIADHVNDLTRRFIKASPFVCVGTAAPGGGLDISPRGDPAGLSACSMR